MSDSEMTRTLILCGIVELGAWGAAWYLGFALVPLVAAIAISTAVAGVIVAMQRKRRS